jgi:putative Holliday junction resolvase
MPDPTTILGLDVGEKRIGVARGNSLARLATPLAVVTVDGSELKSLDALVKQEGAERLVVGLPRGLNGQNTAQTAAIRQFGARLEALGLPIHWQDEAGTTKQAEAEAGLAAPELDARAAAIILQDYLDNL